MSSHKEAPGIANDPAADNTDVYVFVSPDKAATVTLIANFVPLEDPAGGPNFFEFGDDVLYEILIDNTGDAKPDIIYQFSFTTEYQIPNTFLYNVGPIESLASKNWNRRQFVTVSKVVGAGAPVVLGTKLPCPPCNIGPNSTPNYVALANEAIHTLDTGEKVFAGQRAEGFYVDLGAIFDLGVLRPFHNLHLSKMPASGGINSTKAKNINSIAIQVPKTDLTSDGSAPTDATKAGSVIGVYARASRQASRVYNGDGTVVNSGPFVQISRLANPLFNEVLIPIEQKDKFNSQLPENDSQYAAHVTKPELSQLLPVLYPGVFPKLDALNKSGKPRADLQAILLTGIPAGIIPGFQNVGNGTTLADLLRLNMAVPPTTTKPSNLGLVGGDAAGFPNGRRVFDDVTTIELRALAGVTYKLIDPTFVNDPAAGAITPGLASTNTDVTAENTVHYLSTFPYLGTPHSGFKNPSNNKPACDLEPLINSQIPIVPVGPPQTGQGLITDPANKDALIAGGLALAGAVVAGGVAVRHRAAPAGGPSDDAASYAATPASEESAPTDS